MGISDFWYSWYQGLKMMVTCEPLSSRPAQGYPLTFNCTRSGGSTKPLEILALSCTLFNSTVYITSCGVTCLLLVLLNFQGLNESLNNLGLILSGLTLPCKMPTPPRMITEVSSPHFGDLWGKLETGFEAPTIATGEVESRSLIQSPFWLWSLYLFLQCCELSQDRAHCKEMH